jgi:ATP-dependent DNA ligase
MRAPRVGVLPDSGLEPDCRQQFANLLDALPPEARSCLRKCAQPQWVSPMLATLTDECFSREGWLFEAKLDEERCLAFADGSSLPVVSRYLVDALGLLHKQDRARQARLCG